MKAWTSRRIFVCLLGIVLGFGMTLSAVQANSMSIDMTLAGDMSPSGTGGCDGCGGDDGANSGSCPSVCISSVFVMPAPAAPMQLPDPAPAILGDIVVLSSAAFSPDPHPPRSVFPL